MKKICRIIVMVTVLIGVFTINTFAASSNVGITYRGHIQTIGWQNWKYDGDLAGTQGQALRIEGFNFKLTNSPIGASIKYQTHVQTIGWQGFVKDGELGGTEGQSLRVEAIKLLLVNLPNYSVLYRAHVQRVGWQPWVADGVEAGTDGKSLRVEAVEARIVPSQTSVSLNKTTEELIIGQTDNLQATSMPTNIVNQDISWKSSNNKVIQVDSTGKITATGTGVATVTATAIAGNKATSCTVTVKPVVVTSITLNKTIDNMLIGNTDSLIGTVAPTNATNKAIDWKSSDTSVAVVNTSGKVTGVKAGTATITATTLDGAKTANCTVNITGPIVSTISASYQGYVQNIGWQSQVCNGEVAGTVGKGLRVEALKINLIGAPAQAKINYQAYVQNIGWQDWVSNGQEAGTEKLGLHIEALKISLANLPGYTVMYRTQVQSIGWQPWKMNGNISGTLGRTLQVEAIEIKIVKTIDVQYQIHVQDIGWKSPVAGGVISGTNGLPQRIEALNVKLTNPPEGASIKYRTHVDTIGWLDWVNQGQDSGTEGKSLGIQALEIELINAPGYSVQYQVEVEKLGWQSWTSDGKEAGTVGKGLHIRGIRIRIVENSDESTILTTIQSTVPVVNSISYKLNSYLNSTENIQSVEARAVALHSGETSNNCVYFSSETMRRIGVYVPTSMANTANYVPYLSSMGLTKNYNLDSLSLGNICFTVPLNNGNPTHTFVFMDWLNPDDHSLAYVADNQGATVHIRSMIQTAVYDAFSFFFH
mgnify:CR=1 FL=1